MNRVYCAVLDTLLLVDAVSAPTPTTSLLVKCSSVVVLSFITVGWAWICPQKELACLVEQLFATVWCEDFSTPRSTPSVRFSVHPSCLSKLYKSLNMTPLPPSCIEPPSDDRRLVQIIIWLKEYVHNWFTYCLVHHSFALCLFMYACMYMYVRRVNHITSPFIPFPIHVDSLLP